LLQPSTYLARVLPPWWLFLLTSIGWMLVLLVVLRFDYVERNRDLFGIVADRGGVLEFGYRRRIWLVEAVPRSVGGIFIATGIVSFIWRYFLVRP